MDWLSTPVAFLLGLSLLIGVHEYGHYRAALACGVKVLRFSIGMGPVLWRWQSPRTGIEYALSAIPLGGYVRMLDGREDTLNPQDHHQAFNHQSVGKRAWIVAAGPLANLLLALVLYTGAYWWGVPQTAPVLAAPVESSPADAAGFQSADRVTAVRLDGADMPIASHEDWMWQLTQMAASEGRHEFQVSVLRQGGERDLLIRVESDGRASPPEVFRRWGFAGPWTDAVITAVSPGSAAETAGLRAGDRVIRVNQRPVADGQQLRRWILDSGRHGTPAIQTWQVVRDGRLVALNVIPRLEGEGAQRLARIGAYIGTPPEKTVPDWGFLKSVGAAIERVWDVSTLSLHLMGQMLVGQASLSNLSGPITIADYAGRSANAGWIPYILFLALISVSLGVLNLLPLPLLDGGHLMVYIYEALAGRPLSDRWLERLQRFGLAVLAAGLSIALYNDLARLLG